MTPLDTTYVHTIAGTILDTLQEIGYDEPLEAIPGLIQAIIEIAKGDDFLLDAAANFLADGGADEL